MSHYREQPLRDEIERLEQKCSELQRQVDKAEAEAAATMKPRRRRKARKVNQ